MRYPADHKAKTHAKILDVACRCFRERGIRNVSVADVMAAADLTHGGFYSHFKSKDALVAEVIRHGLDESLRYIERWGHGTASGTEPLARIINNYLSSRHRDNVGSGCPLPLLGPEIARGNAAAKRAFDDKVKEIITALGQFIAGNEIAARPDAAAITILATIVGGMLLARQRPGCGRAGRQFRPPGQRPTDRAAATHRRRTTHANSNRRIPETALNRST